MYKLLTILFYLLPFFTFAQNIDGIKIGQKDQSDKIIHHDNLHFQVMPVVSEANGKCYGVMYMPIDSESNIPTTLTQNEQDSFESYIEDKFKVEFDSTINYQNEYLKFAFDDGIEYEINVENINGELDTYFVVWYEKIAVKVEDFYQDVR
ncbi:hypothetical protein [Flammeovirga pacifica]|uniref:Uncharacterized protein n=1 Tax=Flammeovirga pacifica TaxID=915059 RepID=A0A1S1YTA4_FLAPC|nr:hypothetical protein [Flammeovirga pacifica]OHX64262.1 hypothetical protein NH26_21920 [Flammeovirga pacifica]